MIFISILVFYLGLKKYGREFIDKNILSIDIVALLSGTIIFDSSVILYIIEEDAQEIVSLSGFIVLAFVNLNSFVFHTNFWAFGISITIVMIEYAIASVLV